MHVRKLATILAMLMLLILAAPVAQAAEAGSTWDQVKAAGSNLWDKAKEKAPEVKEKVQNGISNAQGKISDFQEDQEGQFWGWFENQTGGTTNDDAHNPDGNAEYELGPNDNEPYEPGPGATESKDNPSTTGPTASQSDSVSKEVLDAYGSDGVYYHNPNGSAAETKTEPSAAPDADGSSEPAQEVHDSYGDEVIYRYSDGWYDADGNYYPPNMKNPNGIISVNGKLYQLTSGRDLQQTDARPHEDIVIDNRTYRHYFLEDELEAEPEQSSSHFWERSVSWTDLLILVVLIGLTFILGMRPWRRRRPHN